MKISLIQPQTSTSTSPMNVTRKNVPAGTYEARLVDIKEVVGTDNCGIPYTGYDFISELRDPRSNQSKSIRTRYFVGSNELSQLVSDFEKAGFGNDADEMIGAYATVTFEYHNDERFGFVKARTVHPKADSMVGEGA